MSEKCNVLFWRDHFQHLACKQRQSYFLLNKSFRLIDANQPLWAKKKKKGKKQKEKYLKFRLLKWSLHNDRRTWILNWNQWTDLFTILATYNRQASKRLPDKSFMPYKCICITLYWYINAWTLNLVWCHSPALVWVSQAPTATVRWGKCHRPGKNEWHTIYLE